MASKQQLTAKIEALKAEKNRLIENCGDTTINQREIYRAQIREIEVQINNLVTERLNSDDEETTDAHGNALCERCHSAHIFYADSERYCQSCLLAIESEYDAKIAREEAQSLYNSDSGVDTDDYRAYMDKYAPELVTAAATTPAANTETVSAKAVKQTAGNNKFLATMKKWYARHGKMTVTGKDNYSSLVDLVNRTGEANAIESALRRTHRNRAELEAWLIEAGVIAAPANSEPQADVTPAARELPAIGERVAVTDKTEGWLGFGEVTMISQLQRAMMVRLDSGDFWAGGVSEIERLHPNALDKRANAEIAHEDAQPERALTDDERAVLEVLADGSELTARQIWYHAGIDEYLRLHHVVTKLYLHTDLITQPNEGSGFYTITDAGRAAIEIARSDAVNPFAITDYPHTDEQNPSVLHNHIHALERFYDNKVETLQMDLRLGSEEIERQQAEIRALESKLAAALAALEAVANEQIDYPSVDDYDLSEDQYTFALGKFNLADKARKALAALQQSGADEGK